MPPVVAYVASTIFAATSLSVAASFLIANIVVYGTAIFAATSLAGVLRKKPSFDTSAIGAGLDQGRMVQSRDPIAYRRLVLGQCRVSGNVPFMHLSPNNQYLYFVLVLAGHECEEIDEIKFGDTLVELGVDGNATGFYSGFAQVRKFMGSHDGERDLLWESEIGDKWTADMIGVDVCRLHIRLLMDQQKFPSGQPIVSALVKGAKLYDPRTETYAYSNNAALAVGFMLNSSIFGKGIALSRIRSAPWIESANICDEDVLKADDTYEKRYTINGTITTDMDIEATILDMLGAMAGHVADPGGLWTIRAGAWREPSLFLTEKDMAGPFTQMPRKSRQDTFNGVRGVYFSPENNWAATDVPVVFDAGYIAEDGGVELYKDVALNYTTSSATAQRLFATDLHRSRMAQTSFRGTFFLKAMQCEPGDVIGITKPNFGWTEKYFEVGNWALAITNHKKNPILTVKMDGAATAESVWAWASGEQPVNNGPTTTIYDPKYVTAPTSLTLSTDNLMQFDGTIVPRLRAQFPASADRFVRNGGNIHVDFKHHSSSDWIEWDHSLRGTAVETYITDVLGGDEYDVRVRYRNVFGVYSEWTEESAVVSLDTTAPDMPTNFEIMAGAACIIMDWADNVEPDLSHYEIRRNIVDDISSSTVRWTGLASQHVDFDVVVGTTYYYWLKAVDTSVNRSAPAGSVSAAAFEGEAGGYTEFIYKRAASIPTTPTGDTPAGWSDAPPAADGNPLWMSTGDFTSAGSLVGAWSTPVQMEGAGLVIEYSEDGSTGWHDTFTPPDDVWARHKVFGGAFTAAYRIVGETGAPGPGVSQVADVVFSFSPAKYSSPSDTSTVTLTCATSGAVIYYEYEGLTKVYTLPFGVDKLVDIFAWASKDGMVDSPTAYDMYEDNT